MVLIDKIAAKLKALVPTDKKTSPFGRGQSEKENHARQIEALYTQLTRLEDTYLAGAWDLERYTDRKKQIEAEIADVQNKRLNEELEAATRQRQVQALQELLSIPDLPG